MSPTPLEPPKKTKRLATALTRYPPLLKSEPAAAHAQANAKAKQQLEALAAKSSPSTDPVEARGYDSFEATTTWSLTNETPPRIRATVSVPRGRIEAAQLEKFSTELRQQASARIARQLRDAGLDRGYLAEVRVEWR